MPDVFLLNANAIAVFRPAALATPTQSQPDIALLSLERIMNQCLDQENFTTSSKSCPATD